MLSRSCPVLLMQESLVDRHLQLISAVLLLNSISTRVE